MIQLSKTPNILKFPNDNIWYIKINDEVKFAYGRRLFTLDKADTRYTFNLTLPFNISNMTECSVVATNVYINRDIAIWTAAITKPNTIRLDVQVMSNMSVGDQLGCYLMMVLK